MTSDLTVYTSPGCMPCRATIRKLNQLGIEYARVDVTEDPDALAFIKSLGYSQAPVVVAGDVHWSGYAPDKIARAVANS